MPSNPYGTSPSSSQPYGASAPGSTDPYSTPTPGAPAPIGSTPPPSATPYTPYGTPAGAPPSPYGSAQGQQPGQQPYGSPYGSAPYGAGPYGAPPRTDGVSIAALVTGILFLGIVPIVLGIIGLGRTKKPGVNGRGFAIAGIVLGAVSILFWVGMTILFMLGLNELERSGELDRLTSNARTYGDDAQLDALWDKCKGGDGEACDELYDESPLGSEYEEYGNTCGGRYPEGAFSCENENMSTQPTSWDADATTSTAPVFVLTGAR